MITVKTTPLAGKSFDSARIWEKLFQKRVVHTNSISKIFANQTTPKTSTHQRQSNNALTTRVMMPSLIMQTTYKCRDSLYNFCMFCNYCIFRSTARRVSKPCITFGSWQEKKTTLEVKLVNPVFTIKKMTRTFWSPENISQILKSKTTDKSQF